MKAAAKVSVCDGSATMTSRSWPWLAVGLTPIAPATSSAATGRGHLNIASSRSIVATSLVGSDTRDNCVRFAHGVVETKRMQEERRIDDGPAARHRLAASLRARGDQLLVLVVL